MKKYTSFLLFLGMLGNLHAVAKDKPKEKDNSKVNITIEGKSEGQLLLRKLSEPKIDTLSYTNGKLIKSLYLKESTPMYLADLEGHYQIFFADPNQEAKLNINLGKGLAVTKLEGSKSNEVFRTLIGKQEPIQQFSQKLSTEFQKPGSNKDSLNQVMQYLNGELKKNFFNFIQENGGSEVAAFVVYSSVMNERTITAKNADTMFQFIKEPARSSFYGKELTKTVNKLKSVEPGNIAPDFTLSDSSGKPYTLRKIKAEYILIDFWASWCGPCKAEIPHMKKAYEEYHAKGFEILGVSIDQKNDAWRSALVQYKMPWIHVIEKDQVVSDLYHFPTIPKTVLIDKTGKIIAADLRGAALETKLAELLK